MVSGVSFRGPSLESARDILNNPQSQQRQQAAPANNAPAADAFVKPKKHSFLKAAVGTIVAAAVIAGGLVAGHKLGGFDKLVAAGAKDGANIVAKYAGKAAKGLNTAGQAIADFGVKAFESVKGLFGKGAEAATEAAETVA